MQAGRPSSRKQISPAQAKRLADQAQARNETMIMIFNLVLCGCEIGVPVYGVWVNGNVPLVPGFILVIVASIVLLKLISYLHCNYDLR